MARPTKLTPEIGERLAKLIGVGIPMATACRAEGITKRTLKNWRNRGLAGEAPYDAFWEQIDRALAKAEAAITMNVIQAAKTDWRAGAWWLERRRPKTYGNKQTVRLEKPPAEMTDEELDAAIALHGYVKAPQTDDE